jgi:hypothetical protein
MHPDGYAVDAQPYKLAVVASVAITARYHPKEGDIISPAERLEQ